MARWKKVAPVADSGIRDRLRAEFAIKDARYNMRTPWGVIVKQLDAGETVIVSGMHLKAIGVHDIDRDGRYSVDADTTITQAIIDHV